VADRIDKSKGTVTSDPISVRVDFTKVKQPEIVGFANRFVFRYEDTDFFELELYEKLSASDRVLPVYRAHFPIDDALSRQWDSIKDMYEGLKTVYPGGTDEFSLAPSFASDNPVQAVTANFVSISRHGLDGQLDFFYVTPRSVVDLRRPRSETKDVRVHPLGTITCSARLILRFMQRFDEARPRMLARLRLYPETANATIDNAK
jgi:hypothetical protein